MKQDSNAVIALLSCLMFVFVASMLGIVRVATCLHVLACIPTSCHVFFFSFAVVRCCAACLSFDRLLYTIHELPVIFVAL